MDPDGFQQGWHHGMGATLELLAVYGAILLIAALVAGGLWWARRRRATMEAPLHRWPTASLASPPPKWGRPQWPTDEGRLRASHADRDQAVTLLREATTEGYLTLDEFEERSGKAYSARYLRDLDQLVDDIPGHPRPAALESAHGRPGRPAPTHGRPGRPAPGQGHWQPLPARAHPAFGGAWIVFALIILTIALHGWWLPIWPVVLIGFLVLRGSRHHRRGLDGHWGSRV
ncbi:MAG: DUF1707 domain-containing protein [Actinobacteria bacterium]|nr:MAG: DUF1707 domain-containing protein [Actinomycetota bacterium]